LKSHLFNIHHFSIIHVLHLVLFSIILSSFHALPALMFAMLFSCSLCTFTFSNMD